MPIIIENNIIKELHLDNLDEKVQSDILTQMTGSVLKRIAVNVLEQLSDEGREEFLKLQEIASPEEMEEFLNSKLNNYENLVYNTVTDFKKEIKESITNLKKV